MQIIHALVDGRTRVRVARLRRNPALAGWFERNLRTVPRISSVSASSVTGSILIISAPGFARDQLLLAVTTLLDHYQRACASRTAGPGGRHQLPRRPLAALFSTPPPRAHWHGLDPDACAESIGVGLTGLSAADAARRLRRYGANTLGAASRPSDLELWLRQFKSLPVALLGGAALLSVAGSALLDAAVILAVVGVNAVVGYLTERMSEQTIRGFSQLGQATALVLRDGVPTAVALPQVTLGDVLVLRRGDAVPADARILQSEELTLDESSLTGESLPVAKNPAAVAAATPLADRSSMIYRGTLVTGGSGRALVVAVGRATEIGALQEAVETVERGFSPLQRDLDRLGERLSLGGLLACAIVFVVGVMRGHPVLQMVQTAVSLAVSAIPEGLPAVATTTIALGIGRLRERQVAVRHLAALETLGAVQTICLDKTGTLTENRMSVVQVWMEGVACDVSRVGPGERSDGGPDLAKLTRRLLRLAALCTEVRIIASRPRTFEGSSTEVALLEAAARVGVDVVDDRKRHPVQRKLLRSESHNFMRTDHGGRRGRRLVVVKGSPAEVLALCTHHRVGFHHRPLDDEARGRILAANEQLSADALRVLGVAYALERAHEGRSGGPMTWVGLVGMADRIRPGIRTLIRELQQAGIRPVMITGDQPGTARAIARAIGLAGAEPLLTLGAAALDAASVEQLSAAAGRAHVFARVSPGQKLQIVRAIQASGQVVAMTGDGVNDGPALKAANVGIAMGESAAEIAREIASVVVLGDRPARLRDAVAEGRAVYRNVQRSVNFLLSTNGSETLLIAAGIAAGLGEVLTPRQLLWINLISDLWPSLALALAPPGSDLMTHPPRDPKAALITRASGVTLAAESGVLAAGSLAAFVAGRARYGAGSSKSRTLAFLSLTIGQLLHALRHGARAAGSDEPPNRQLWLSVTASLAVTAGGVSLSPLRRLLGLAPVDPLGLLAAVACAAATFGATGSLQTSGVRPVSPGDGV